MPLQTTVPDHRESIVPDLALRSRVSRLHLWSDSETTAPEYFVGVVPAPHEDVVECLRETELGVSYVSYPKYLVDEHVNCRAASSWVYRTWPLSHFQLHVVLFELPPEAADEPVVYVFCHHEPNWVRHPVRHLSRGYLNPDWGRSRTVELLEDGELTVLTCEDLDDERYGPAGHYCRWRGECS